MDAAMAERLASSGDPKGLAALAGRSDDPVAAKAVAEQFGAFLMQGLMQQSDGDALPMASGVGGSTVSAMFANQMGRVAMAGDKLGLADVLLRSMNAKQAATGSATGAGQSAGPSFASPPPAAAAPASAPASVPSAPTAAATSTAGQGFSLAPYWLGNGRRPIGSGLGHAAAPANPQSAGAVRAPANPQSTTAPAFPLPPRPAASAGAPTSAPSAPLPSAAAGGTVNPSVGGAAAPTARGATGPQSNAAIGVNGSPAVGGSSSNPTIGGGASTAQMAAFVNDLAPSLQQAAAQLGVSPKILLAQAALETGWGRSVVGNNVFGVKAGASWSGSVVQAMTHEVENGQTIAREDAFRSYPSVAAAVQDYVTLISGNERYQSVIGAGGNVAAYARGLASGGYATDAGYMGKLQAIAASPALGAAAVPLITAQN